ncbi:PQQ-binding-like beta-propeller repeat protein [Streptomyces sp. NBC_00124]|uniref:protein kinase domain-containing protein n=1 Tax=Streptomyces sp. NBC_00124 TaxID=2975662 RepID=UPI00225042A7|nr:PQQ-binding-like beta-propeller repeat protein [Streptomyces sp. NBC_00124]MCX5360380.1 PQQ-binding-like beta-propeller repeat protein [Streptomyces sp. NBC_00124]
MGGHGTESGEPGRWIGPYRVVALLGEGGMGAVYLGRDTHGQVAAVKVLRPETARDEVMVRRFRREADAASAVRGTGVAPVLGYDLDGPVPWIAAAYLAGPTLHEAVAEHGVLGEAGARALLGELARAVAVIHEAGLVHRDLKPSNIVLTREGARIIDFGIARPEYGLTLTQPGAAPATPGYAPPEQITGRRAGPPADVFALGAVLVFACTGRAPFGTGHPAAVGYRVVHEEPELEGVPEGLVGVARACLAKQAGSRPTPGELVGWVEGGFGGASPRSGPGESGTGTGSRWGAGVPGKSGAGPASGPGARFPEESGSRPPPSPDAGSVDGLGAESPASQDAPPPLHLPSPPEAPPTPHEPPPSYTPPADHRPSPADPPAARAPRRPGPGEHPLSRTSDGPRSARTAPAWLTPRLSADIDHRHAQADHLLRTATPVPSPTRRRLLTAAAALAVPGVGAGVWWLTRDPSGAPDERTENGVPVAEPLAAPTADTVPAALWRAEGLHPDGPGPVTVGQVVAAGTSGGVAAWAQHTGRRAWSWNGAKAPDRLGDLLLAGPAILVVTGDGRLTGLDSRTGKPRWRTGGIGAAQLLAVDAVSAYVLDRERRVRAVGLTDRRVRWTSARAVTGVAAARAAVTRQRLLVCTDDGIAQVFDTANGSATWRWTVGTPALIGGGRIGAVAPTVWDGAFCVGGRPLALLDAHTGKARWTLAPDPAYGFYGAPTIADGRVYTAATRTALWCLDARSGVPRWTVPMDYSGVPRRADVVVGHALYGLLGNPTDSPVQPGADRGVYTVDIRTGRLMWTFADQADPPGWRLAGAAGRVFVARRDTLRAMPTL